MATFSEKRDVALNIATFLRDHPWVDEYNGLDAETLKKYLEYSYLDSNGQPFARDKNFYNNIINAILNETIPPQQANQQVPPHFASLLVDFVKEYEKKKSQGLKKKSKIISSIFTDPKAAIEAARKEALQCWEIQRQRILLNEIRDQRNSTFNEIAQDLTTALSGDSQFIIHQATSASLTKDVINTYKNKIITNEGAEPKKLLEEAIKEELEKIGIAEAPTHAAETVNNIPESQMERLEIFSKAVRDLTEASNFSARYQTLLKDKMNNVPINNNQEFEAIHEIARQKTTLFAEGLRDSLKKAGFSETEIDQRLPQLVNNILYSTAESPFVSELIHSPKSFDDLLTSAVENAVKNHFNPQGIRSYVPFLNKRIAYDERTRYSQLISDVKTLLKSQPSLSIILKTASYNTYSANRSSIEGGDPIGRIPYVIKIELLGARNPKELNDIVQSIKSHYTNISASQIAALRALQEQIANFHIQHPNIAKVTSLYYRHTTAFAIAKVATSTLLLHPEYAIYVPQYWVNVIKSQWWELKIKQPLIRNLVEKSSFGKIAGLWYHRTEFGFYENPLDHFKHDTGKFILRKSLSFTGSAAFKIGTLFNNQKIIDFSNKLLAGELIGKIAGFWSISGTVIKQVFKWVGIGIGAIFLWATTYGIPGLIGFGASLGVGIAAGIKAGIAATTIGGPLVGIVVGAFTTLAVTFLGTGLTAWALSHGLIPHFGGLGISTTSAASLPGALGSGIAASAGQAAVVSAAGIVGLGGASLYYTYFLESAFNPYRDLSPNTGIIEMQSKNLNEMFRLAANDFCIPVAALKAISQTEAPHVWTFTDEEVAKFSKPNWWVGASQEDLKRGYCQDTCANNDDCGYINRQTKTYCPNKTDPGCAKTTVYGPMQFEELTWIGIFGDGVDPMTRCHLPTAIQAAAQKMKANSGEPNVAPCDSTKKTWDKDTFQLKVARAYCGRCGTEWCTEELQRLQGISPIEPVNVCVAITINTCGTNYCGKAWDLYQEYSQQ